MEQGSQEWFDARRGLLTGSNVGAALGINPWKKPEDLIRQMVREYHDAESEFQGNIATEYGSLHEPLAVMDYMGKTGNFVEECSFFVHPECEWLGASPDGLIDSDGVLEVKCPFGLRNKKGDDLVFKTAEEQPHYYAQIQAEMASTGRAFCHFYQWTKHGDSLEVVPFNPRWWGENLPKLREFYEWYLSEIDNTAHLKEKQKEINTFHAQKLIQEWDELSATIDDATARKKEILAELVNVSKERDAIIHGRKLTLVKRKGAIDYGKIPELKSVDLEQYRKSSSEYWKLS